jgi:Domain of unknown function (DUF4406)
VKVIYVAGKYSGKTHDARSFTEIERNIITAREWAIRIMESVPNVITLVPHLNSYHMELDFTTSQDFWYNADLELLRRCDAIFMLPDWQQSKGARIEWEKAKDASMPIFETLAELQSWMAAVQPVPPAASSTPG